MPQGLDPHLGAILLCLLFLSSLAGASGSRQEGDAFRLRVANAQYGPVEIGIGSNWFLVGRVVRAATDVSSGAGSSLPAVIRVSPNGMAFGVGGGRLMKLLPDSLQNRKDRSAIVVNMPATSALFKDFLPPAGSPVQQSNGTSAQPLAASYSPAEDDVLEFTVRQSAIPADKLLTYAKDAAEIYRQRAISQLYARGKSPISGSLTVTGKLAPDEDPGAVTFMVDGSIAGILNHPPYTMKLDTRQWSNGEHLIEIKAVDRSGGKLTRTRALVVVENSGSPPS